ncbi:MAG: tyrosine-type recombinase/integrase [Oscillospiraceae bacterium]
MLFKDWWKLFYETCCIDILSYDCCEEYSIINTKHFTCLQDLELMEIKPFHVRLCIKSASDYSSNRKRKVFFLLHRILEEAMINELVDRNIANCVKPPKLIKKEVEVFSIADVEMILNDVENDKFALLIAIDLNCGLRRGELMAFPKVNVNLEEYYLKVSQTLVHFKDGFKIVETTKSRKDRIVPLNEFSRYLFMLYIIKYSDENSPFIFSGRESDKPMSFKTYHKYYRKYLEQKGISYLSPHKLRHTYATYMLKSGGDIDVVRRLLGHSSIATTQRYIHSGLDDMRKATDNLKFF